MKQFKSYILALLSIIACQTIHTDNVEAQEVLSKLGGAELRALDDTYYIALENIEREGATYPDKERVEQHLLSCIIVQYNLQLLCEQLLAASTHPEAKQNLEEFQRRLENRRRQEDTYTAPDINYDLQTKNNFSGYEFAVLDLVLTQACQTAIKENSLENLLFIVSLRCSLLQQSTQLLLASSHEQASEVRKELFQRLAHCTAIYRSLLKQLQEEQDEETTAENQETTD